MFIERLRLKGFKSFGGTHELTFSPGFTAIVGPNGSGKSNILDGLRWVLGEGSPTCLRITKQSDLLFQGSISLQPATSTEVALSLREDPKICTIKRDYASDTGSVIAVDGMRIRLQDLEDVKRQWHLEGERFSFIGQGEVAEAIHQRPMQRRAVLEALFGIDQYRKKREDASQKLKSATEELTRLETLVFELTTRRDEIAPLVVIAAKARELLDELEEKRRYYYFSRRAFLERKLSSFQCHIDALERRKNRAWEWQNIWEDGWAHYQGLVEAYERQQRMMSERIASLRVQRESLKRQCFTTALSVKSAREHLRTQDKERKGVQQALKGVQKEAFDAKKQYETVLSSLQDKEKAVLTLSGELSDLRSTVQTERELRQKSIDEHSQMEETEVRLRSRLQARQERLEKNASEMSIANEALLQIEKDIEEGKEKFDSVQIAHKKATERHGEAYSQCQQLASSLSQLKKNVGALENQLDALFENTEQRLYPEPVRVVLAAQKLGKLPLKVKMAAESFLCEERLASCLEAYLGGRQFWLFVQSFEDAAQGIELVKKKKAGRVTFLPLERCHPRCPDYTVRLPQKGIVGWATELISPDPFWEIAVKHLLGDLLIVEEYSVGMALSREGASFPMVTLDGDVFTVGGSVSGGKFRKSGGAIERRLQIEELEKNLNIHREELKKIVALLQQAEDEERLAAEDKERWKKEEQEMAKQLSSISFKLDRQKEEKVRLENEYSLLVKEVKQIKEEHENIQYQIKRLEETIASFGDLPDETELEQKLAIEKGEEAVFREKVKSIKTLISRIDLEIAQRNEKLQWINDDIQKAAINIENSFSALQVLGKNSFKLWQEKQQIVYSCEKLLKENTDFTQRIALLSQRSVQAQKRVQVEEEKLKDCQRQIDSAQTELNQIISLWEDTYHYPETDYVISEYEEESFASVRRLEKKVRELGEYDLGVLSENESLQNRLKFLSEQIEDVHLGIKELKALIRDTDERVGILFGEALKSTDERFNSLFQRLFGGGEAHLELEEGLSLWEAGVDIFARPPGKRLQNLTQLSGGEQSLTAIALLFATMEVAEVPLAILDEVDAALDEYNLLRFVDLVTDYAANMQILAMTHRRSTMERADVLYGVTMDEPGLSKVIGVHLDEWTE